MTETSHYYIELHYKLQKGRATAFHYILQVFMLLCTCHVLYITVVCFIILDISKHE